MLTKAIAIWLVIMVLAVLNGAMRQGLLAPRFGQQAGHVISTISLCTLILVVAWLAVRWMGAASWRDAWLVGGVWLALTLAFEFLAGHYIFGEPWKKLLAAYDLLHGQIWLFVPLTTLVAPMLAYWLRARR